MKLGDNLGGQDYRILELEDNLEVLRSSYASLIEEISSLQVLSRQASMREDWEERNVAESSTAVQQRSDPASNETQQTFENDHERRKALRVYIISLYLFFIIIFFIFIFFIFLFFYFLFYFYFI